MLIPTPTGDIVAMGDLAAHATTAVRAATTKAGAQLSLAALSSPDRDAFSNLKTLLR